jgi:prolipoprotein diacylglyceryltransferase
VHPIVFQIGSFTGSFLWRDDRAGVSRRAVDGHAARPPRKNSGEKIADITLWLMVGGIIGARLSM